jgi:hypothetical protein
VKETVFVPNFAVIIYIYIYIYMSIYTGLTLILLTTTKVAPPSNASKWQMGFNSASKGLSVVSIRACFLPSTISNTW